MILYLNFKQREYFCRGDFQLRCDRYYREALPDRILGLLLMSDNVARPSQGVHVSKERHYKATKALCGRWECDPVLIQEFDTRPGKMEDIGPLLRKHLQAFPARLHPPEHQVDRLVREFLLPEIFDNLNADNIAAFLSPSAANALCVWAAKNPPVLKALRRYLRQFDLDPEVRAVLRQRYDGRSGLTAFAVIDAPRKLLEESRPLREAAARMVLAPAEPPRPHNSAPRPRRRLVMENGEDDV